MTFPLNRRRSEEDSARADFVLSEPLLADTSVITESVVDSIKLSPAEKSSLLRNSTLVGVASGMLMSLVVFWVPLLTFYLLFVKFGFRLPSSNVISLLLDIYRALIILFILLAFPCVLRRIAIRHVLGMPDSSSLVSPNVLDALELRIALGILAGVLLSEVEMCWFLDYSFWDFGGLSFGLSSGVLCLGLYCFRKRCGYSDLEHVDEECEEPCPAVVVV